MQAQLINGEARLQARVCRPGWRIDVGIWLLLPILLAMLTQVAVAGSAATGVARAKSRPPQLPESIRRAGVLTVGSQETFAPVEFRNEGSDEVVGVSADLLREAARRLGVRIQYVHAEYAALISGLQARRFDIASGGISDTVTREQALDFINYFSSGVSILVQSSDRDKLQTIDDFCGKSVAVMQGSQVIIDAVHAASRRCQARRQPVISIAVFPATPDVRLQLHIGRVDAYLSDYPALVVLEQRFPGEYRIVGGRYMVTSYIVSWGVLKGNTALRDALQTTMQQMLQDGTYLTIMKRWHVGDAALSAITINLPASKR